MNYSNGGTSTDAGTPDSMREDYSTPLYDEVNGMPDMPDTIPWCPEDDPTGVVPMHGAGMDSIVPKSHRLPAVAYGSMTLYTANGTGIQQNVDFPINSAIVWNYSPQWVLINREIWVPPNSIGGVIRLTHASQAADISWGAPPGSTQLASVTGALCVVQFCEESFEPQQFTNVAPAGSPSGTLNTSQVAVTTGTSIIAANGARRTVTIFNAAATGGNAVYIGPTSTVTTTTGGQIPPQTALTLSNYSGAIYGSATGGSSTTVTVTEEAA